MILYHGSPNYYDHLERIWASTSYDFALCYSGNKWHDGLMNQSRYDGILYLTELIPNILNITYNRSGYIYTIIDNYNKFKLVENHPVVYKTENDYIEYDKCIKIDNILNTIRNDSDIVLSIYPDKPFWWNKVKGGS